MTVARPPIISRADAGLRPPRGPYSPGRLEGWSYHHWAAPFGWVRPFEQDAQIIRGIQSQHMDTNGWTDIAGNFYVTRSGRIFEARPLDVAAGITGGFPWVGGVEHEGYFHPPYSEDPHAFAAQWEASVWLDAWVCEQYGWDPRVNLKGHREWDPGGTACPGDLWVDEREAYLGAVAALMVPTPVPIPHPKEEHVAFADFRKNSPTKWTCAEAFHPAGAEFVGVSILGAKASGATLTIRRNDGSAGHYSRTLNTDLAADVNLADAADDMRPGLAEGEWGDLFFDTIEDNAAYDVKYVERRA